MKLGYVLLCLCACGSPYSPMNETPPPMVDDSGMPSPVDAGIQEASPSSYNDCVTKTFKMSSYPRLRETWCTDSNGMSFLTGYLDVQLSMTCRWRTAADQKVRCLPKNEQSIPLYVDPGCSKSNGFSGGWLCPLCWN